MIGILAVGVLLVNHIFKKVKPLYNLSTLHFADKAMKNLPKTLQVRLRQKILRVLKMIGLAGAVICLIILFSRPASERKRTQDDEALDIITLIDGSGSMTLGNDVPPNRFDAAKNVLMNLIEKATNERIGVIFFGMSATTAAPLTSDYTMLKTIIGEITADNILDYFYFDRTSNAGTVIGDALLLAVQRYPKEHKYKVAIIISDGENNGGYDPDKAAAYAKKNGVIVYTIFIGNAPYANESKNLQSIATITGGKYYTATDKNALTKIFDEITKMEKNKIVIYSNSIVQDQPDTLFILFASFTVVFVSLKYIEELWN
jgi:Ca-activated chloride channel family protein